MEPNAPLPERRFTRAEYNRMGEIGLFDDERVELLYGRVVPMSAMGDRHAYVGEILMDRLVFGLRGRARLRGPSPFLASDHSEPEPDFGVFPIGLDRGHPSVAYLLIEISDSSLRKDLGLKARLYAEVGVPEYWVLDLQHDVLVVHRAPREGRWTEIRELSPEDRVAIAAFPDVAFAVRELLGL